MEHPGFLLVWSEERKCIVFPQRAWKLVHEQRESNHIKLLKCTLSHQLNLLPDKVTFISMCRSHTFPVIALEIHTINYHVNGPYGKRKENLVLNNIDL